MKSNLSVKEIIGGGYDEFWKSTKRYVVCKGSRASKKSTTAALKLIVRLMQMPLANALVVRQTQATLKDSCYAQLQWAIEKLGVEKFWKATVNPLQLTYIPTNQKILFRGCDDAEKIKSITVSKGFICFCWLEEASEIEFDEFDKIDKSLRAQMPEGYYIQWLITFNPTSAASWLKSFFFDTPRENVLAMTTTYKCNEWLSPEFLELMEYTRQTDPDRYRVDGLGDWGLGGGQYFGMWRESLHIVKPFEIPRDWLKFRAMDFGQARPYAVIWFAIDYDGDMYAYRELYGWGGKPNVGTGETAKQIGEKIAELEKPEENLIYGVLDSACWARNGVTGPTISEELNNVMIKNNLPPFIASSKGRLEGANAFKQRLIGNQLEDGTYKPAIKFFSTCIHCIRTIPMIGHDKHKPELPDTNAEDHCFVAGTLIHTKRGEVPIEEVTTDDEVLTRKGYRKVLVAGMTRRKAKVITVVFSNGITLTGTPNHPIFVKGKGFVTLDTVNYGDIICSVSEVNKLCQENKQLQQIRSYSMGLRLGDTLTQKKWQTDGIIALTGGFANKEFLICTEKFGNIITAKSLLVAMFIIRTAISSIMTYRILNCLTGMNIWLCICTKSLLNLENLSKCRNKQSVKQKADQRPNQKRPKGVVWKKITSALKNTWKLSDQKPPSGIGQKKEENGIGNTGLNVRNAKLKSRKSNAYVYNAGKSSTPQVTDAIAVSIAPLHVAQSIAATTELMMRPESVSCAAKNSELIVSAKLKLVAENAEVSVVAIREENKTADVYNLTVDGEHEYFANGFLVHNCYDAVAYMCLNRTWIPTRNKKADDSHRWRDKENTRSAWTY